MGSAVRGITLDGYSRNFKLNLLAEGRPSAGQSHTRIDERHTLRGRSREKCPPSRWVKPSVTQKTG